MGRASVKDDDILRLESLIMVCYDVHKLCERLEKMVRSRRTSNELDVAAIQRVADCYIARFGCTTAEEAVLDIILQCRNDVFRILFFSQNKLSELLIRIYRSQKLPLDVSAIVYPPNKRNAPRVCIPLTCLNTSPLQRQLVLGIYEDYVVGNRVGAGVVVMIDISQEVALRIEKSVVYNGTAECPATLEKHFILGFHGSLVPRKEIGGARIVGIHSWWAFPYHSLYFPMDDLIWMCFLFNDKLFMSYRDTESVRISSGILDLIVCMQEWDCCDDCDFYTPEKVKEHTTIEFIPTPI